MIFVISVYSPCNFKRTHLLLWLFKLYIWAHIRQAVSVTIIQFTALYFFNIFTFYFSNIFLLIKEDLLKNLLVNNHVSFVFSLKLVSCLLSHPALPIQSCNSHVHHRILWWLTIFPLTNMSWSPHHLLSTFLKEGNQIPVGRSVLYYFWFPLWPLKMIF